MPIRALASAAGAEAQGGGGGGPPKLLVFGGSGFLGSRISEEAQRTGLAVVSISRGGAPPAGASGDWVSRVQWVKGDVFDPASWEAQLEGAVGVVSTLGAFGSNDFMYRVCGEANMQLMEAAAAAKVPRFAFISVHDYGLPGFVLPGYFNGKRDAEKRLASVYPEGGVALRPGFIYGTRQVGSVGIPLQAVGVPLDKVTAALPQSLASIPLLGAAFVPPVAVETVAKAAVRAVTDPSVPSGIMMLDAIKKYGR